jgi:predicted nucleotidyltransferase
VGFEVDDICDKYGINYLGLFGSVARGEETSESDVDCWLNLIKKEKLVCLVWLKFREFERRLGRRVDW